MSWIDLDVAYFKILSRVVGCSCLTYKTGFEIYVWIYCTLYIHNSGLQAIQCYCWSAHFTLLHTHYCSQSPLVLSRQRIYKSHCQFKSHMESSFHSRIPFLPLFRSCQFLCSQAHILASWRLGASLHFRLGYCSALLNALHGPRKKQPLCCWEGLYTDLLPSNGPVRQNTITRIVWRDKAKPRETAVRLVDVLPLRVLNKHCASTPSVTLIYILADRVHRYISETKILYYSGTLLPKVYLQLSRNEKILVGSKLWISCLGRI
jgi:hypothetical protein